MKRMISTMVFTLVMLVPGMAADVHALPAPFLVASDHPDRRRPPVLIIKGQGGKVTGVEKGDPGKHEPPPGKGEDDRGKRRKDRK